MSIFHGGRDRNCPIELTRELIEKLTRAGARVEFEYEPDAGHQAPGPQTIEKLRRWLSSVLE
jgi:predicted esterase